LNDKAAKEGPMQQHVEHIVHGYDEDLNTLTSALSEMGGQVESMIA